MPGTYSQILLHIVFATKKRHPWLTPPVRGRVHDYLGGIVKGEGSVPLRIGGISDHVHLLVKLKTDAQVSTLVRNLKSKSTGWMHKEILGLENFAWQEGYAVFSVSQSGKDAVCAYIENQEQHHKEHGDYRVELLKLLHLHEIPFEERWVFDDEEEKP